MVTDAQVKGLFKAMSSGKPLYKSAERADMSENTARKYVRSRLLPKEQAQAHTWRTRPDPFADVWAEVEQKLHVAPALEAKTLFDWLNREYPGRFEEGQLRTLQRRLRQWRAEYGEGREVFFPQEHHAGRLCSSDFTSMNSLGITIQGRVFPHLLYHFVLTWSNWEDVTICFSECMESLREGLQNALWRLGGVPRGHLSDCLSAAVNNLKNPRKFTAKYHSLLGHYGLEPIRTNPSSPHENGDVESRNNRGAFPFSGSILCAR